ncbi:MAG: RNA-binding S4 domain-containing protein [Notoacmeibacter sp.]
MAVGAESHQEVLRLDKWLVYARFCKTRSQASALIAGGLRINGRKIEKPDKKLRTGDVLTMAVGGQVRLIRVLELAVRRGSAQLAQEFYEILPMNSETLE